MIRGATLAVAVSLALSATACRQTPEAKAEQARAAEAKRTQAVAQRIAQADANPT